MIIQRWKTMTSVRKDRAKGAVMGAFIGKVLKFGNIK